MEIATALRLKGKSSLGFPPPRLALVGAGGKTTTLFHLAREVLGNPYRSVLLTTTTHLGIEQIRLADWHLHLENPVDLESCPPGIGLVTGVVSSDGRVTGLHGDLLEELHLAAEAHQLPLFIEADGSRLHPIKAPAIHEPAIPPFVDWVIVLAGLSAFGKPLKDEWVHRPKEFSVLTGQAEGETITMQAIVRLLNHPNGGLKNIPSQARRVVILSQVVTREIKEAARQIAMECLGNYTAVLTADLTQPKPIQAVYEPIAGVILAAGEASRYGHPKQLLSWKDRPLVRHAAETALQAGCMPVLVVVGAYADQVRLALQGMPVQIVQNSDWREGMSSSVKVAVQALPAKTGGAVFLLSDQPQVTPTLIRELINLHQEKLCALTAPRCEGLRANPVLFDRITFSELLNLKGDVGGRALFSYGEKYPIAWLDWDDSILLMDIDTPEDLQRLKERSR